jgi:hypothetical protein
MLTLETLFKRPVALPRSDNSPRNARIVDNFDQSCAIPRMMLSNASIQVVRASEIVAGVLIRYIEMNQVNDHMLVSPSVLELMQVLE